jgi:hypothetical protein
MRAIILAIFTILFTGCAIKTKVDKSQSATILLKTPKIKYYDTGFINYSKNSTKAKIFSTGVEILAIDISSHICLNSICYTKDSFNKEYLSRYYSDDILENIFKGNPILNKKNIEITNSGFNQIIIAQEYAITYKVTKDSYTFKDSKNSILIKIKLLNQKSL